MKLAQQQQSVEEKFNPVHQPELTPISVPLTNRIAYLEYQNELLTQQIEEIKNLLNENFNKKNLKQKPKSFYKKNLTALCLNLVKFLEHYPNFRFFIINKLQKYPRFFAIISRFVTKQNYLDLKNLSQPPLRLFSESAQHIYETILTVVNAEIHFKSKEKS